MDARLFYEDSFADEVLEEQEVLLEEFVYGRMTREDRSHYQRQIEGSAELQGRIAERRELMAALERLPAPASRPRIARLLLVLAPALALLLCFASILYLRELQTNVSRHVQMLASSQAPQSTTAGSPPVADGEPVIAFLSANITRSASSVPVVHIARSTSVLELQVEVRAASPAGSDWDAKVMRGGEVTWSSTHLSLQRAGQASFLSLLVDGRSLRSGSYVVQFYPRGEGEISQIRRFDLEVR